ncbi:hypothetical protein [Clostridium sp. AWRP]|nr:hypothetical protein [Clostridium sp. AWRP]
MEERIVEEEIREEKIIKQGDMKYYILETMIFVIVSLITWFLSR